MFLHLDNDQIEEFERRVCQLSDFEFERMKSAIQKKIAIVNANEKALPQKS